MANNTTSKNLFAKYPALKAVAGVAVIAAFLLIAISLRNSSFLANLDTQKSDASCYGYGYNNCISSVSIGGRVVAKGYANTNPFSYGTLNIKAGSVVELTYNASNVDRCQSDWTRSTGSFQPPLVFGKVDRSREFVVTCYKERKAVRGVLRVEIIKPTPPIKPTLSTGGGRHEDVSE